MFPSLSSFSRFFFLSLLVTSAEKKLDLSTFLSFPSPLLPHPLGAKSPISRCGTPVCLRSVSNPFFDPSIQTESLPRPGATPLCCSVDCIAIVVPYDASMQGPPQPLSLVDICFSLFFFFLFLVNLLSPPVAKEQGGLPPFLRPKAFSLFHLSCYRGKNGSCSPSLPPPVTFPRFPGNQGLGPPLPYPTLLTETPRWGSSLCLWFSLSFRFPCARFMQSIPPVFFPCPPQYWVCC